MANILIGRNEAATVELESRFGNRHGMVAGATGTGKTVSLMLLAEGFSRLGVPVVISDLKGDVAGLACPAAEPGEKLQARLARLGLAESWKPQANPVVFWDIYGERGHQLRTTISEMGPILLARIMELNDTQQGVLEIIFKVADDNGWLMLDLADLRAMLAFTAENRKEISASHGLVSAASISAVQRALLRLEQADGERFFGEPALELPDLMRQDMSGNGIISIIAADRMVLKPRLYSTFLLWLLSELFEQLPEVGDQELPKLIFFFDEAHLLFEQCPPALEQRITQVVRLIRSKGVGVYFCSQNPDDVPGVVLGQLGNRVQHALRAFTPRDQKAVRAAAETFVANPRLKVAEAITELAVGEALASTLRDKGVPSPVERVLMATPTSRLGTISDEERATIRSRSPVGAKYDTSVNRESAAELLAARAEQKIAKEAAAAAEAARAAETAAAKPGDGSPGIGDVLKDAMLGTGRRQGAIEAMTKSVSRSIGSGIGRQIVRGILGGFFKG